MPVHKSPVVTEINFMKSCCMIPCRKALIEADGRIPVYKCIEDNEEFVQLLKCKLQEEVAEFLESNEAAELCDVVEVVYALLKAQGMSLEEFERLRLEKASVNGGFDKRILLNDIID